MIENVILFKEVCKNQLARYMAATTDEARRAVLGRDTVKGLMWAIDFCDSLNHEVMTDREFKHAMRLTTFRGNECPAFNG